ncbi:hypothetical protein [Sulfitobacter sp. AS59]|uniref:hypothetical protein n=1 Tax=Sulfitobacter sp. AS59 TaxID=3135784 RepID=UPI003172E4D3
MSEGNLDEIRELARLHRERMDKAVFIDKGYIVISVNIGPDGDQIHEYDIELSRCDSHEKILSWVEQLLEKTWMEPDVLSKFIQVALSEHGLELPHI